MNINEKENEILEFWEKDKTFEKSLKGRKKDFVFYDGPPFATGLPHYGHLLASAVKDTIPRFWTMRGYKVDRVWGWDCHGLPIEAIAEKEMKIKSKKGIEVIGIDKFCSFCESMVLKYAKEWKNIIRRLGRWVEFDNSYRTMDVNYMESVWWAFKEIWKKGLIYEGRRVLLYCPKCETPLANAEIAMDNSYKNVNEDSVTIKLKLKGKNEYFLAWTTTPWTLIGNIALAINPQADYVKVENAGKVYILALERLSELVGEHKIIAHFKGRDLEGIKYEPLYRIENKKEGYYVLGDEKGVNTTDGTGIVHMAAYGEFDYEMIKKFDLPLIEHIRHDGTLKAGPKNWIGKWFKDLDKEVIADLKNRDLLYRVAKYAHSYPFCYRCETPLFYAPLPSWFINIQKVKNQILKNNEKINWYPSYLKEGRFKYNIENAPDWNISRNRYWASVIPIWKCGCGKMEVIGSIAELKEKAVNLPKKIDLHKNVVDKIKLKCTCGKEMSRIPEVLDCWFESGAMPFAQMHYPFENNKWFEKNFPGDFVAEYIAQTRTWFYYMLAISTMLFNDAPFLNVSTTGTILAEDGSKMSKSLGNFPDPIKVIEKYGSDALRFYLLGSIVMDAEDMNFSEKGVDEIYKKVLLLLYNVNNFYSINSAGYKLKKVVSGNILDKWIESKLNELNIAVEDNLKKYNTVKACRAVFQFVDDLSTWYVRRSRERFNSNDDARSVLGNVLLETSKIIAPLLPFVAEAIYQSIKGNNKSVHLENWPKADKNKINKKLNLEMAKVREIVSLVLKERDIAKIPLRQPLGLLAIRGAKLNKELSEILLEEVNVKKVIFEDGKELSVELNTKITPQLEAEGYARDFARNIQAARKSIGLKKSDRVNLRVVLETDLKKMLSGFLDFLKERTNSGEIEFVDEILKKTCEFELKGKKVSVLIL